jgi:hypothetical protein
LYAPHVDWGKQNWATAEELRPLYPRFDDFFELRQELDPEVTVQLFNYSPSSGAL